MNFGALFVSLFKQKLPFMRLQVWWHKREFLFHLPIRSDFAFHSLFSETRVRYEVSEVRKYTPGAGHLFWIYCTFGCIFCGFGVY